MNAYQLTALAGVLLFGSAAPVLAQNADGPPSTEEIGPRQGPPPSVFDDTWLNVGVGIAYSPTYTGSDDYKWSPLPIIQGRVAGVDIAPRPAGFALDFIADPSQGPAFALGPTLRIRSDRANRIKDPVVQAAGALDAAVEIGPSAGIKFPGVLRRSDSISIGADIRWDIAGAHDGMVINPSITYFTPVSRGAIVSLSLGTEYVDDSFADYYFSVSPLQSTASGLPAYTAKGGFTKLSATSLVGLDLDGNALNGGWGAVVIAGYSRLVGDAAGTPYTVQRGSRDQVFVGLGLGYTF